MRNAGQLPSATTDTPSAGSRPGWDPATPIAVGTMHAEPIPSRANPTSADQGRPMSRQLPNPMATTSSEAVTNRRTPHRFTKRSPKTREVVMAREKQVKVAAPRPAPPPSATAVYWALHWLAAPSLMLASSTMTASRASRGVIRSRTDRRCPRGHGGGSAANDRGGDQWHRQDDAGPGQLPGRCHPDPRGHRTDHPTGQLAQAEPGVEGRDDAPARQSLDLDRLLFHGGWTASSRPDPARAPGAPGYGPRPAVGR